MSICDKDQEIRKKFEWSSVAQRFANNDAQISGHKFTRKDMQESYENYERVKWRAKTEKPPGAGCSGVSASKLSAGQWRSRKLYSVQTVQTFQDSVIERFAYAVVTWYSENIYCC